MPYADDYLKLTLPNISIQHCRCVHRTDDVEKHNRANRSIYIVKFYSNLECLVPNLPANNKTCVFSRTLLMPFCCCWKIWMKRSFMLYTPPHRTDFRCTHWTQKGLQRHRKQLKSNTDVSQHALRANPPLPHLTLSSGSLKVPTLSH